MRREVICKMEELLVIEELESKIAPDQSMAALLD